MKKKFSTAVQQHKTTQKNTPPPPINKFYVRKFFEVHKIIDFIDRKVLKSGRLNTSHTGLLNGVAYIKYKKREDSDIRV